MIRFFFFLALAFSLGYSQRPSWLVPQPSAAPVVHPPAAALETPRIVTKIKEVIKLDTITVYLTDTIVKVDTLRPPKPIYYTYTIYYEILSKKLTLHAGFEWSYQRTAQKTVLQSSDTTLLNLGNEILRSNSFTYDNYGNKTETFEKIIEGLDMRIYGSKANITYRTDFNLISLDGRFDTFGLLQLSSDFSRRRYFLAFIPVDFLFGSEKYTLFLRIEKAEVN